MGLKRSLSKRVLCWFLLPLVVMVAILSCRSYSPKDTAKLSMIKDDSYALYVAPLSEASDNREYYFKVCVVDDGVYTQKCANAFANESEPLTFTVVPVVSGQMNEEEKQLFTRYRKSLEKIHADTLKEASRNMIASSGGAVLGGLAAFVSLKHYLSLAPGNIPPQVYPSLLVFTLMGSIFGYQAGGYVADKAQALLARIQKSSSSSSNLSDIQKSKTFQSYINKRFSQDTALVQWPMLLDEEFDAIVSPELKDTENTQKTAQKSIRQIIPLLATHLIITQSFEAKDITKWCLPQSILDAVQCYSLSR